MTTRIRRVRPHSHSNSFSLPSVSVAATIILMMLGIMLITQGIPQITGFVAKGAPVEVVTQDLDLVSQSYSNFTWLPVENGRINSIKITGRLIGSGSAKVYLSNANGNKLIIDTENINQDITPRITGLVVLEIDNISSSLVESLEINNTTPNAIEHINDTLENISETINNVVNESILENNETANIQNLTEVQNPDNSTQNVSIEIITPMVKEITTVLEYGDGPYDVDNNGIESVSSAIDYTIENTEFSWQPNENLLCTQWAVVPDDTDGTMLCHGASECCSLLGIAPENDQWDAPLILSQGLYGAKENNTVSARIIYANYSLEGEIYEDIQYSNFSSLPAQFIEELEIRVVEFSEWCEDTCIFPASLSDNYTLIIEPENASLEIDSITYTLLMQSAPSVTIISPEFKIYENSQIWLNYTVDKDSTIMYSLDGEEYNLITENVLLNIEDGLHNISVRATDNDNKSSTDTVSFIVRTNATKEITPTVASAKKQSLIVSGIPTKQKIFVADAYGLEEHMDYSYKQINQTTWQMNLSFPLNLREKINSCINEIDNERSNCLDNITEYTLQDRNTSNPIRIDNSKENLTLNGLAKHPVRKVSGGIEITKSELDLSVNHDTILVHFENGWEEGAKFSIGYGTVNFTTNSSSGILKTSSTTDWTNTTIIDELDIEPNTQYFLYAHWATATTASSTDLCNYRLINDSDHPVLPVDGLTEPGGSIFDYRQTAYARIINTSPTPQSIYLQFKSSSGAECASVHAQLLLFDLSEIDSSHYAYEEIVGIDNRLGAGLHDVINLTLDDADGSKDWFVIGTSYVDVRTAEMYGPRLKLNGNVSMISEIEGEDGSEEIATAVFRTYKDVEKDSNISLSLHAFDGQVNDLREAFLFALNLDIFTGQNSTYSLANHTLVDAQYDDYATMWYNPDNTDEFLIFADTIYDAEATGSDPRSQMRVDDVINPEGWNWTQGGGEALGIYDARDSFSVPVIGNASNDADGRNITLRMRNDNNPDNIFEYSITAFSTVLVTGDTAAPASGIEVPGPFANISGNFLVNASANDTDGTVASVSTTLANGSGNATKWITMTLGSGTTSTGNWNATVDSTIVIDGNYNVSVNATDATGLSNITLNVSITIDNTYPNVSLIVPSNGTTFVNQFILINASVNDSLTKVQNVSYRFINHTYTSDWYIAQLVTGDNTAGFWNLTVNGSLLPNGDYNVTAKARDFAGSENIVNISQVTIDNADIVKPDIYVLTPVSKANLSGTILINVSINDTQATSLLVNVTIFNNTGNTTDSRPMSLGAGTVGVGFWNTTLITTELIDGNYNISINATDNSGNIKISENRSIIIDNSAPNVGIMVPTNNSAFNGTSGLINASVNDSLTQIFNVTFRLISETSSSDWLYATIGTGNNGVGYWNTTMDTTALTDDKYNITVNATDFAGNQLLSNISEVVVNNTVESTNINYLLNTSTGVLTTTDENWLNVTILPAADIIANREYMLYMSVGIATIDDATAECFFDLRNGTHSLFPTVGSVEPSGITNAYQQNTLVRLYNSSATNGDLYITYARLGTVNCEATHGQLLLFDVTNLVAGQDYFYEYTQGIDIDVPTTQTVIESINLTTRADGEMDWAVFGSMFYDTGTSDTLYMSLDHNGNKTMITEYMGEDASDDFPILVMRAYKDVAANANFSLYINSTGSSGFDQRESYLFILNLDNFTGHNSTYEDLNIDPANNDWTNYQTLMYNPNNTHNYLAFNNIIFDIDDSAANPYNEMRIDDTVLPAGWDWTVGSNAGLTAHDSLDQMSYLILVENKSVSDGRNITSRIHTAATTSFVDESSTVIFSTVLASPQVNVTDILIDFVDPTDADGAVAYRNHTYINFTIANTSTIDTVGIEWNGTNITLYRGDLVLNLRMDNNTNDSSGYNHHGTPEGGVQCSLDIDGQFGTGCTFDNSNDVIRIGNSSTPGHPLDFISGNFTLMAWINNTDNAGTFIAKRNISHVQYQWYVTGGLHRFADGLQVIATSDTSLVSNELKHVAFVLESNGTGSFYLNGQPDGNPTTLLITDHEDVDTTIGARWEADPVTGFEYGGMMDDVRIYNKPLTPKEIQLYYRTSVGKYYANITENEYDPLGNYSYYAWINQTDNKFNRTTIKEINLTATAMNNVPEIWFNYTNSELNQPVVSVNPVEGSTTAHLIIDFNVSDADGATNLDDTSAKVNASFNSTYHRTNDTGNCEVVYTDGNNRGYRCIVPIAYYDNSSTLWKINATVSDNSGGFAYNDTVNATVNDLLAFSLVNTDNTLGGTAGTANNELAIGINNTGNFHFTSINLTPYVLNASLTQFFMLGGGSTPGTANFSINKTPSTAGFGTNLVNATPLNITGNSPSDYLQLPVKGMFENGGNSTMYIYIDLPNDKGLTTGIVYNTSPLLPWELFAS